jgi:hypothetical protein
MARPIVVFNWAKFNLSNSWRTALFGKLIVAQLVKKFTDMLHLKLPTYLIPLKFKYFHRHFVSGQ